MPDPAAVDGTVLTERQAEVLSLRSEGLTQREIAERLGTSVANVSSVERAGRRNVESAERTLVLAELLRASTRVSATPGTDLRVLVDRIYDRADAAGTRVAYTEPELSSHLKAELGEQLDGRQLRTHVEIGITDDGKVDVLATPGPDDGAGPDR
jgi:Tfx family DNA-binding protein